MAIDPTIAELARDVVSRYIRAINDCDADGVTDTLNFPHFRIGLGGRITHYPDQNSNHLENFHRRTSADGWHKSVVDRTNVILAEPTMAHIGVWFRRLRADGSEIGAFYSTYFITELDGHWGIQGGAGNGG